MGVRVGEVEVGEIQSVVLFISSEDPGVDNVELSENEKFHIINATLILLAIPPVQNPVGGRSYGSNWFKNQGRFIGGPSVWEVGINRTMWYTLSEHQFQKVNNLQHRVYIIFVSLNVKGLKWDTGRIYPDKEIPLINITQGIL